MTATPYKTRSSRADAVLSTSAAISQVVGNVNEHGLMITETTFGGRGDLSGAGTGALIR